MSKPVPWHLWQRARTAFRLMQDLGALSGALGLWGALAGFGVGRGSNQEPRAAHAAARLESASTVGFIADQDLLQFIRISSHAPSRRVNFYQVFGTNLNPYNLVFPLLERRLC